MQMGNRGVIPAVRAEIRTKGVVDENKNCKLAGSGIVTACVCIHRDGTGGAAQDQCSRNSGSERATRHAGGNSRRTVSADPPTDCGTAPSESTYRTRCA